MALPNSGGAVIMCKTCKLKKKRKKKSGPLSCTFVAHYASYANTQHSRQATDSHIKSDAKKKKNKKKNAAVVLRTPRGWCLADVFFSPFFFFELVHLITHQTNSRHPSDLFILLTDFSVSEQTLHIGKKKKKSSSLKENEFKCELMMNGWTDFLARI